MANLIPILSNRIEDTILATSSKVVDSIPLDEFHKIIYDSSFDGSTKVKGFRLEVINANSQLSDNIGFRLGDLPLQLLVSKVGLNAEVKVTNPNGFDINFIAIKTKL